MRIANRLKSAVKSGLFKYLLKWAMLSALVSLLAGSASAFFLVALDAATSVRITHRWLLLFLPVAGFLVGWIYLHFGRKVEAGNNLLIDEIHNPNSVIPLRMAPLVLGGTLISHLVGASVGREGTAVQMGASLADQLTHVFRLDREDRRLLLMAGISAGFASIFGTPLAGAIFGLEVLVIGRMSYTAILPCFLAAIGADQVCLLWGAHHTHYAVPEIPSLTFISFAATLVAGALFGLTGRFFAMATHRLGNWLKRLIVYPPLRPLLGGTVLAVIFWFWGADRYAGLGIPVIQEAFLRPVHLIDFAAKSGFTIVSLASGFKGGEVTPLFYIGATFGNVLAPLLHMLPALLTAMGFVAVFAGAANVPLASTLMAMELFGSGIGVYAGIACVLSYLFSGYAGIYRSQRLHRFKIGSRGRAGDPPPAP